MTLANLTRHLECTRAACLQAADAVAENAGNQPDIEAICEIDALLGDAERADRLLGRLEHLQKGA